MRQSGRSVTLLFVSLFGMMSQACSVEVQAVPLETPSSPPDSLVPKAEGDKFASAISLCRAYGNSLSKFAQDVKTQEERAGTWATVAGAFTVATAGTVAALGGYYGSDTTANKDKLANVALFGGMSAAAFAVPSTVLASRTKNQNTEASAARTAAKLIDDTVIKHVAALEKASELTDDKAKAALAFQTTQDLISECRSAIHATDVPNVPQPTDGAVQDATPAAILRLLKKTVPLAPLDFKVLEAIGRRGD